MTRSVEIRAPSGETEGTRSQILRWLKRLGESVAENEPLIEIETDKVTVELASPGSGVLREILKQEQEEIAPGELLGRIESGAAAGAAAAAPAIAAAAVVASAAAGTAGAPARRERRGGAAAGELSPAVSRLLRERGLDAAAIRGTGPGGRVTVEDVLRGGTAEPREPGAGADAAGEIRRVPHTAVRKRIAEHMVQSLLRTAPHVTTVFEADLAAVLADRSRRREEFARRAVPLTLTAYFEARGIRAPRSAAHPDRVLRAGGGRGDPRRARSQQPLDRYGARDPRADSHRRGDGGRGHGAARAGAARCRVARPVRHRARPERPRDARPSGRALARGPAGRHLHHFQPRRQRQPPRRANHH